MEFKNHGIFRLHFGETFSARLIFCYGLGGERKRHAKFPHPMPDKSAAV
jgi:hypothetical protein